MSDQLKQLKEIFHEIFQLDQAELDFGIYRIMRQKRAEVDAYLEGQLLNDLKLTAQREYEESTESIREKIVKAKRNAFDLGYNPDDAPLVKKLEQELQEMALRESLEDSVLSDLVQFLGRYYKDGDFLSLPRYRKNSYAIEYNGEEVKLHWANTDQYYVKTAERFRDYRFLLPDGKAVHFKITAANTESGNNKSEAGKERRFQLLESDFMREENGELLIFFHYAPDEQKLRQSDINSETVRRILEEGQNLIEWRKNLSKLSPTENNKNRTLLEKHLTDYTARNTFDYFIHKDLEGFLRRELDFYIKNEIVMLDDIENEEAPRVELYLAKVKALRRIGHKLIAFLTQVENFCKKLFLKKKFLIRANYCVTIDLVPNELWAEVLVNDSQIQEWRDLYAIDDIKGNLINGKGKLNAEFLEANQNLIIDTRHFSEDWKLKLLANFEELDTKIDGLLIKADNFHALSLLQAKYAKTIKCIYIDPPYNTGNDGFMYKDGYRHSSWLTMLENRLEISQKLLNETGIFYSSYGDKDENNRESTRYAILLDKVFGESSWVDQLTVVKSENGMGSKEGFATNHEFVFVYKTYSQGKAFFGLTPSEAYISKFNQSDSNGKYTIEGLFRKKGAGARRQDSPNCFYPVYYNPKTGEVSLVKIENWSEILPKLPNGDDGRWTWSPEYAEGKEYKLYAGKEGTIYLKDYWEDDKRQKLKSVLRDSLYLTDRATNEISNLFGDKIFSTPKPVKLIQDLIENSTDNFALILDYFSGSATTSHAVINLNRQDGGHRKYILVETSEYFDLVTLPRVKKVIYSKDWKDGKPISREGSSHLLKYFALESYEDAMNNLELHRRNEMEEAKFNFSPEFQEDYLLNYSLEFETQGSQSLLNLDNFAAPFDYKMKIAVNGVGETQETPVDLVETFNYLIGLYVERIQQIDGFRVVRGTTRTGERCLILWRTTKGLNQELTNKRLNDFLERQNFDFSEIDTLYINGDAAIPVGDVRAEDAAWQIKMIETDFLKLMFE